MLTKTPQEISREYYQFAENFTQTDFEDEKFLGKFYTDYDIANKMMQILCKNYILNPFSSDIRIIDPFCGDGRLILSLLAELLKNPMLSCKKIFISVWDIPNYIGANTFAEIAIAFYFGKKVFLLNDIYEPYSDELIAWGAIPLKGEIKDCDLNQD